jgi:large subunit ribosomal protein L35Ae
MEGVIVSFRRGRRTQNMRQMIIQVDGVDSVDKATELVGKTVTWEAPGKNKKVLSGKITAPHGGKGVVRSIWETGVPGQALGAKVNIQ